MEKSKFANSCQNRKRYLMDQVFQPGLDNGLYYVKRPKRIAWKDDGASLQAIPASQHEHINEKLKVKGFDKLRTHKIAVVKSSPVVMENVKFVKDWLYIDGKALLAGQAGDRFFGSIPANIRASDPYNKDLLGVSVPIPEWCGKLPSVFTVDCRNFYNLYHFMLETMPLLMCLKDFRKRDLPKEIIILAQSNVIIKPFIIGFINILLGEEIAGRIKYSSAKVENDEGRKEFYRVLSCYSHRHYISQTTLHEDDLFMKDLSADHPMWATLGITMKRGFLKRFTVDSGLKKLNSVRYDWDGPKKVLIVRKSGRDRHNQSIDNIKGKLEDTGFIALAMEDLSPRQQIAMWGNADTIVGEHGAAFSGMMFARRETKVIEIGNLQTKTNRWGDFFPNAHASGCNYINVLTDVDCVDPADPPSMSKGHRGPLIGPRATDIIMDLTS